MWLLLAGRGKCTVLPKTTVVHYDFSDHKRFCIVAVTISLSYHRLGALSQRDVVLLPSVRAEMLSLMLQSVILYESGKLKVRGGRDKTETKRRKTRLSMRWTLYSYVNGCTKMSYSLCCSDTWCGILGIIALLKH